MAITRITITAATMALWMTTTALATVPKTPFVPRVTNGIISVRLYLSEHTDLAWALMLGIIIDQQKTPRP